MKREKKEKIYFIIFILLFLTLIALTIYFKSQKGILLGPGDNNATFISQNVPSQMQAGQAYQITITLKNTGINTWTAAGNYKLGDRNFGNPTRFGPGRIMLNSTDIIMPGEIKTFTFWLSAPQDIGTYYFQLQMVEENVEWFGDQTPRVQVDVIDNRLGAWGNADPEPALAWLAQSSSGKATWLIHRPRDGSSINEPGPPCPNGFGWNNTQLTISQLNKDGTISRKEITVKNCILRGTPEEIDPWGSTPDLYKFFPQGMQNGVIIPEHWAIVKSSGLKKDINGMSLEEYQPYPGIIIVPPEIIPDGQEHLVQKCYSYEIYYSENGRGNACYDATCYTGGNIGSCPGRGNLINSKYIVYDYCEGNFCYANENVISSPVNFRISTPSVLRVSYTLTTAGSCTDAPILTEEQWFAEGIGFIGFSNNDPSSPAPNSVDFYDLLENPQCLPYWDGLCNVDPYNYNNCCPPGHTGCTVYLSDRNIPSITLTNPTNGLEVFGTINLQASATDNINVDRVEFYIDNFLKSTDTVAPYTYTWDTSTLPSRKYKITARAYDTTGNFATTPLIRVNLTNPILVNNALFVSQQVAQIMNVGQAYQVNITFNNTGTTNWTRSQNYRLGSQNPQDNTIWGLNRINLGLNEIITPGQVKKFSFTIAAPQINKTYNFSWKMIQDGVEWFGSTSQNLVIDVVNLSISSCGNNACDNSETCSTCSRDCGTCNGEFCGNNICNATVGETCSTCSVDCGSCGATGSSSGSGSGSGSGGSGGGTTLAQCSDGIDNDNDGLIDYPADLGCATLNGNSELDVPVIDNPDTTIDNDGPDNIEPTNKGLQVRIVFLLVLGIIVVGIIITVILLIRFMGANSKFNTFSKIIDSRINPFFKLITKNQHKTNVY